MILQARLRGFERNMQAGAVALLFVGPICLAPLVTIHLPSTVSGVVGLLVSIGLLSLLLLVQQAASYNNAHLKRPVLDYAARGKLEPVFIALAIVAGLGNASLSVRYAVQHHGHSFSQGVQVSNAHITMQRLGTQYQQCNYYYQAHKAQVDMSDSGQAAAVKAYEQQCEAVHRRAEAATAQYKRLKAAD